MVEFEFRRPGRQCSVGNRPLEAGEEFYSVLMERDENDLVRIDIAASAWTGPPEGCLGWWRARVPELQKGRVYWAPPEVLLLFFQHSIDHKQHEIAYVMALLLMRKRILAWTETRDTAEGRELVLSCARNQTEYVVRECELQDSQVAAIQSELSEKLFTDQADAAAEPMEPESTE